MHTYHLPKILSIITYSGKNKLKNVNTIKLLRDTFFGKQKCIQINKMARN